MKTIAFSSIKGGVGKSSLAIMIANILHRAEKRVLFIDADPQNSASHYFLPTINEFTETASLANVLRSKDKHADPASDIQENMCIINELYNEYDLVPSNLELIHRRNCDITILKDELEKIDKEYDYCIIDTAPTFDNVIISCLVAADIIITPIVFGTFDFKSTLFYQELLKEFKLEDKWKLVCNRIRNRKAMAVDTAQFIASYKSTFNNCLFSTVPHSRYIKNYFDYETTINESKSKYDVFIAMTALAQEITGEYLHLYEF